MNIDSNTIYLDEVWFTKYRKIHSFTQSRTKDNLAKFSIDYKNRKIKILHKLDNLNALQKNKLLIRLNRKLKIIENLKNEILLEEKDNYIKNFYLEKLKEEENFTNQNISRIQNPENSKVIFEFLIQAFPTPTKKENEIFLNEFIFYLKEIHQKKSTSKKAKLLINDILKDKFFNHKYKIPKIKNWGFEPFIDQKYFKFLDFGEVLNLIRKTLKNLKIDKIVKIRIQNRNIFSVSAFNKRLNIPKNIKLTFKRASEIIEHEIKVHLMRGINGSNFKYKKKFGLKLFEINTKQDLVIEEGLATFFEQNLFKKSNKYDLTQLYQYYIRFIATFLASKNQPFAVYFKLLKLFELQKELFPLEKIDSKESTEIIMTRLYSDFPNPKVGYFNPKISIYLLGNRKIWEMKEKGVNIEDLLLAKISIENNP